MSLLAGLFLIVWALVVQWRLLGSLFRALFTGSAVEVAVGVLLVAPTLVAAAVTLVGLAIQGTVASPATDPISVPD